MVGHAVGQSRFSDRRSPLRQPAEGMEGTLVDVMAIDPEQGLAVVATDNLVGIP